MHGIVPLLAIGVTAAAAVFTPNEHRSIAWNAAPAGRACANMASTGSFGVVMFGGAEFCGQRLLTDSTVWQFDGASWRAVTVFPGRREDAMLAFDPRTRALIVLGGRAGDSVYADMWQWGGQRWLRQTPQPAPVPVEHAAAAFDERRGRLVVFGGGGRGDRRPRQTLWEWDGRAWETRASATGPSARVGHSMIWSAAQQAVLLYGGFGEAGLNRDLWKWDGERWTLMDSAGPTFTEGPALFETDSGLVLIGTGLSEADPWQNRLRVWRRSVSSWEEIGRDGPLGNVGRGIAYDVARRQIVLFGGAVPNQAPSNETWLFSGGRWSKAGT